MNLFSVVSSEFFKPLAGKNRTIFADCIEIIYETYTHELSFGVDKEYILSKLIPYFEQQSEQLVFEDEETADHPREKANAVLRRLKECGWIEYETTSDFKVQATLLDSAIAIIEALHLIKHKNEMEYEASIASIYSILKNEDSYKKPYQYIIKEIHLRTRELINELKKLNTNIKKYIDSITLDKEAEEIIQMFFEYQSTIGSKAFMRMHTSDNASRFRGFILEKLQYIKSGSTLMELSIKQYRELEECEDDSEAESRILEIIADIRHALEYTYPEIEHEITLKNDRYVQTAVARAKFKLTNSNDVEGKISSILRCISDELNQSEEELNSYASGELDELFEILPQYFIGNESLAPIPIAKAVSLPEELEIDTAALEEERKRMKQRIMEKQARKFSRKNISHYVSQLLSDRDSILASEIPIAAKRDVIRLIYVSLYGQYGKSTYRIEMLDDEIQNGSFHFRNFKIERRQ